jgi:uncharacterized protein
MPEAQRVVVVNTTPIIALALLGKLDLLKELYGEVLIPPAVEKELIAGGSSKIGVIDFSAVGYLHRVQLKDSTRADLLSDLDRGEAEVIALGQELSTDLLIIDEKLARRHAVRLGFNITGVLGVLLRAKEAGLIQAVEPLLQQLIDGGIWIGVDVRTETLRLAGEL